MLENRPSIRSSLAAQARRLVAGATDRRFDAVEAELGRILTHLDGLEQVVVRSETEILALRQEADEALAFLRVQHDIGARRVGGAPPTPREQAESGVRTSCGRGRAPTQR